MGTSDHVQPHHCYFGILALECGGKQNRYKPLPIDMLVQSKTLIDAAKLGFSVHEEEFVMRFVVRLHCAAAFVDR
jgi:hypothetical protein